jgi:hypothetical protein
VEQPEQMIIIEDQTTKAQYAVQPEDYERGKDGAYAGYTVVSNEDGTPVEEPADSLDAPAETNAKKKAS